jgi:hypothetical protein
MVTRKEGRNPNQSVNFNPLWFVLTLLAIGCLMAYIRDVISNDPVLTKEQRIQADRSNYAKAVKYHRDGEWGNALKHLYNISSDYSGYKEVKRLIAIDQHNKRVMDEALSMLIRKRCAESVETDFLDIGIDTKVRVSGSKYTTITIKTWWTSRVFVYNFQKTKMYDKLVELGFKRIVFEDTDGSTWTLTQ